MEDYLDQLRKRRVSPRAVEHMLRISISGGKYTHYLAVEGEEDEDFYMYVIESMNPDVRCQSLVCDGKGGVLGLRDYVDREGLGVKISFMIDRDHDDFLGLNYQRDDTYVTDGYSVESDFAEEPIIEDLFCEVTGVRRDDPIFARFQEFAGMSIDKLMPRLKAVMLMVIALRRAGKDPKLDKLSVSTLFQFVGAGYKPKHLTREGVSNLVECEVDVACKSVYAEINQTRGVAHQMIIRGKLMVSAYVDIIKRFIELGYVRANGRKIRSRIAVGKANFIYLCKQHVSVPDTLRSFFEKALA